MPPLILAAVFLWSGIAKLRHPDTLRSWADLGVPAQLRQTWLLRLHPWAEMVLALAYALLGGMLGFLAATAGIVLLATYLVLVLQALQKLPDAACACFGTTQPVTRITVVRNAWLVLIAVAALAMSWMNPTFGGPVAAVEAQEWVWVVSSGAVAVTVLLIAWPTLPQSGELTAQDLVPSAPAMNATDADGELDYIRTRTPAVPVTLADGTLVNLRQLASKRPILLLAVTPTCGPCIPVIENVSEWRRTLPEVDIRLLLQYEPHDGQLAEMSEPQSLHDPRGYVSASIADWKTPTAVLLGADGLLAGGPVTGFDSISEFIGDVYESLHGERPPAVV